MPWTFFSNKSNALPQRGNSEIREQKASLPFSQKVILTGVSVFSVGAAAYTAYYYDKSLLTKLANSTTSAVLGVVDIGVNAIAQVTTSATIAGQAVFHHLNNRWQNPDIDMTENHQVQAIQDQFRLQRHLLNDAPMIEQRNFTVNENAAYGTVVGRVNATDPDFGQSLTFSIVAGNGAGHFTIDPNNGLLTVSGPLNYESNNEYRLTIEVADHPPATPVFESSANFSADNWPDGIAVDDVNKDGYLDLVVSNGSSDNLSVLLGDGTGAFNGPTHFVAGDNPAAVVLKDFNGDGELDAVVVNYFSNTVSLLLGDGAGNFGTASHFSVGLLPSFVAIGDVNSDNDTDLAVSNYGSGHVSVLLGNGNGGFSAATNFSAGTNPASVVLTDVNQDNQLDVVVANAESHDVSVLLGDGAGNFGMPTHFSVSNNPRKMATADLNEDGYPDIVTPNSAANNCSILLGNGAGGFTLTHHVAVGSSPYSVAIGDLNADTHQDLAVANQFSNDISVLFGDGTGNFQDAIQLSSGGSGTHHVALGDFNQDGNPDLSAANYATNTLSILINNHQSRVQKTVSVMLGDMNDLPVLRNHSFYIYKAGFSTVFPTNLSATDEDEHNSIISFRIIDPQHIHFSVRFNDTYTEESALQFKQHDVLNGTVSIWHDGTEIAPSFKIAVSDGQTETAPEPAQITFLNHNEPPSPPSENDDTKQTKQLQNIFIGLGAGIVACGLGGVGLFAGRHCYKKHKNKIRVHDDNNEARNENNHGSQLEMLNA